MGNLGVGVMLSQIYGKPVSFDSVLNQPMSSIGLDDSELTIGFADGQRLRLRDEGQSCCEHRYMTTDDDLADLFFQAVDES